MAARLRASATENICQKPGPKSTKARTHRERTRKHITFSLLLLFFCGTGMWGLVFHIAFLSFLFGF